MWTDNIVALIRRLVLWLAIGMCAIGAAPLFAASNYTFGHINNVTFVGDGSVWIMIDSSLPDNCAGTFAGWMQVPAANKTMIAFVLALWARGDENSTQVYVYTSGLTNSVCQINQIDPDG
jgi:hypothetical protein